MRIRSGFASTPGDSSGRIVWYDLTDLLHGLEFAVEDALAQVVGDGFDKVGLRSVIVW